MKNQNVTLLVFLILIMVLISSAATAQKKTLDGRFQADTIDGVYIPLNLEDCFKQIDSFWDDSTKREMKQWTEIDFGLNNNVGFGMWIRKNWGLWDGSRLSKYFNEIGIFHPDDMSGIILKSYHCYLTGKPVNLEKQTEYYKLWWKVHKEPTKDNYPVGVVRPELDRSISYHFKESNNPGCIFMGTNSKNGKVWIYDYYFGWKLVAEEEITELEICIKEKREEIVRKLFGGL